MKKTLPDPTAPEDQVCHPEFHSLLWGWHWPALIHCLWSACMDWPPVSDISSFDPVVLQITDSIRHSFFGMFVTNHFLFFPFPTEKSHDGVETLLVNCLPSNCVDVLNQFICKLLVAWKQRFDPLLIEIPRNKTNINSFFAIKEQKQNRCEIKNKVDKDSNFLLPYI